jgi:drug/metabolite transporter (DMT)-like permease
LFMLSLILYAGSTVLWVDVLRVLPLSRAYMVMSSAVVLVPLASALVFGEGINSRLLVGIALVITGIVVANYK